LNLRPIRAKLAPARDGGDANMRRWPLLGASLLALLLSSCSASVSRYVQRGINWYHAGNFPAALAELQQVEGYELGPRPRVRYLAYRGLAHLRLGQRPLAHQYLSRALSTYRAGPPGWLPPDIALEVEQALQHLDGAPGSPSATPPAEPPGTETIQ